MEDPKNHGGRGAGGILIVKEINFYSKGTAYGWMSNFHRCRQIVDGVEYPTNEHFYQSQKAVDPEDAEWIRKAPSPFAAMKAGRALREVRKDWDDVKISVMLKGLRAKFRDPYLRKKLIETGDAVLHEDSPTDLFWGRKGRDELGKLLMQVRKEVEREEAGRRFIESIQKSAADPGREVALAQLKDATHGHIENIEFTI